MSALTFKVSDGSCAAKPAAMAPPPSVSMRLLSVTGPTSVTVIVAERAVSTTELTVTPRLDRVPIIISEVETLRLVCDALAT